MASQPPGVTIIGKLDRDRNTLERVIAGMSVEIQRHGEESASVNVQVERRKLQ